MQAVPFTTTEGVGLQRNQYQVLCKYSCSNPLKHKSLNFLCYSEDRAARTLLATSQYNSKHPNAAKAPEFPDQMMSLDRKTRVSLTLTLSLSHSLIAVTLSLSYSLIALS